MSQKNTIEIPATAYLHETGCTVEFPNAGGQPGLELQLTITPGGVVSGVVLDDRGRRGT